MNPRSLVASLCLTVWVTPVLADSGVPEMRHDSELPLAPVPAAAPSAVLLRQAPLPEAPPPSDPARTRLALFPSAETLRRGEIEFTCRGLLAAELAWGATDWVQLGLRSTPLFMLVPGVGPENSLWSGGVRLRILKRGLVTLTLDAEGLAVLGAAGFRSGAALRLGNDRFALHGSLSGLNLWHHSDSLWGLFAQGGLDVRVHRKVKLILEGAYHRNASLDLLMVSTAVRLHGHHFAADLGVAMVFTKDAPQFLSIPLVNLSFVY
jgi:hypothetical protein